MYHYFTKRDSLSCNYKNLQTNWQNFILDTLLYISYCIWNIFILDDEGEMLLYFLLDTVSAFLSRADWGMLTIYSTINWFPIPLFSVFCFFSVLFRVHRMTLSCLFSVSGTDESFFCNSFFPVGIPKPIADKLIFSLEGSYETYYQKYLTLCLRHGCWAAVIVQLEL